MDTGKVLLGVLAGIAAGALIGVLLAPDKGSVTRKKIIDKGEDYTDTLNDKFNEFIAGITEKFEKVKEEVSHFSENGKAHQERAEKV